MRWPLRNQILLRILLLLVVTIGATTFASIRTSITANRDAELGRLQRIVAMVANSRFPLTSPVLEDMRSLSGAEFVLVSGDGESISQTSSAPEDLGSGQAAIRYLSEPSPPLAVVTDGVPFYHTSVKSPESRSGAPAGGLLSIFVPRQTDRSVWWQASKSPMLVALLVLPLTFLVSLAMASQVTRPLARLESQVKQIAAGDIQQIPRIQGNDEIQDLNRSINEMAAQLRDHENQLRSNERLRTLVQFGSSIAHHLRNSATGCKMAVELLASDHKEIAETDNYQVAIRQLGLMNNYIKKFLLLAKSPDSNLGDEVQPIDLATILENVVFLLSPSAKHLGVEMTVESDSDGSKTRMSGEDAEQLMMNLISNGITAASQRTTSSANRGEAFVAIRLSVVGERVTFSVTDSGDGPPAEIENVIFQPFVTGSKEGMGLGLSLVKEISERAVGEVDWRREQGVTIFVFHTGPGNRNQNETTGI